MSYVSEWLRTDDGQQVTIKLVTGEVISGKLTVADSIDVVVSLQIGRARTNSIKVPVASILYWTRGALPSSMAPGRPDRPLPPAPMPVGRR